jgi:hypothetical protein
MTIIADISVGYYEPGANITLRSYGPWRRGIQS